MLSKGVIGFVLVLLSVSAFCVAESSRDSDFEEYQSVHLTWKEWLQREKLHNYEAILKEYGCEDLESLLLLESSDVRAMSKLLPGHRAKLLLAIEKERASREVTHSPNDSNQSSGWSVMSVPKAIFNVICGLLFIVGWIVTAFLIGLLYMEDPVKTITNDIQKIFNGGGADNENALAKILRGFFMIFFLPVLISICIIKVTAGGMLLQLLLWLLCSGYFFGPTIGGILQWCYYNGTCAVGLVAVILFSLETLKKKNA
eukprot:Colp12_sorted_trinity150504_noHs@2632